jgi:hypothetical protein
MAASIPQADRVVGVRLLEDEPELARDLAPQDRRVAMRLAVPRLDLPVGAWAPDAAAAVGRNPFALVLLGGVITREVLLHDRVAAELLSPGDVVEPWSTPDALVPARVRWTVNEPARLAVLDDHFLRAVRRWPQLAARVQDRVTAQAGRLAVHAAICQLGRVDLRVLALFWHLAERWGRVGPDGVIVPLRLTHAMLGRLVGAQRPTVTLAIGELGADGSVVRREDGTWLLAEGSQARLMTHGASEPPEPRAATIALPAVAVAPPDAPLTSERVREELHERLRTLRAGHDAKLRAIEHTIEACEQTLRASERLRAERLAGRRPREPAAR